MAVWAPRPLRQAARPHSQSNKVLDWDNPLLRDCIFLAQPHGGGIDWVDYTAPYVGGSYWLYADNSSADLSPAIIPVGEDFVSPFSQLYGTTTATHFTSDATNDRIQLGSIDSNHKLSLFGHTQVTIAFVARYTNTPSGKSFPRIIDKSDSGSAANGWGVWSGQLATSSQPTLNINGTDVLYGNDSMNQNSTHTAVLVYDSASSANSYIHLDGKDTGSPIHAAGTFPSGTTNAAIGNWNHTTNRMWDGEIAAVYIWTRLLSESEAHQVWRGGPNQWFRHPQNYWQLASATPSVQVNVTGSPDVTIDISNISSLARQLDLTSGEYVDISIDTPNVSASDAQLDVNGPIDIQVDTPNPTIVPGTVVDVLGPLYIFVGLPRVERFRPRGGGNGNNPPGGGHGRGGSGGGPGQGNPPPGNPGDPPPPPPPPPPDPPGPPPSGPPDVAQDTRLTRKIEQIYGDDEELVAILMMITGLSRK